MIGFFKICYKETKRIIKKILVYYCLYPPYKNKELFYDLPIQNNKIILRNHFGSYGCNVKYIHKQIIKENLPIEVVWVVKSNILHYIDDFPEQSKNFRLVMANSQEALYEYATSKIWIESERRMFFMKKGSFKRPDQYYIQTFHGSLGIKKLGLDRDDIPKHRLVPEKLDAEQVDYLVSNSDFTTGYLKRTFWNHGKILQVGHPRNDIFFDKKSAGECRDKICRKYGIKSNSMLVLYAPTFREDRDFTHYDLDINLLRNTITNKFNRETVVLLKLHPILFSHKNLLAFSAEGCIDVTYYSDIQELLAAVDILITDYSSCAYDYILSRKPAFIYASDAQLYADGRGFYYPLSETPFSISENNEQLTENISNFNYEEYVSKVDSFLKKKNCIDNGHASEEIVKLIKSLLGIDAN